MAITIQGVRVNNVAIEPRTEGGGYLIKTAEYSLISSTGKVLAKQSIGGYGSNNVTLEPSDATKKALSAFMASYENDVQTLLGLLE